MSVTNHQISCNRHDSLLLWGTRCNSAALTHLYHVTRYLLIRTAVKLWCFICHRILTLPWIISTYNKYCIAHGNHPYRYTSAFYVKAFCRRSGIVITPNYVHLCCLWYNVFSYSYIRWTSSHSVRVNYFLWSAVSFNSLYSRFSSLTLLLIQTAYVLCFLACHRTSTSWLIVVASTKDLSS